MAFTTQVQRPKRWPIVRSLITATAAIASLSIFHVADAMAQVKAPSKNQIKASSARRAAPPPSAVPTDDVQPFAIGSDGSVADQLVLLKVDPSDAQAAADAVAKAMGQLDSKNTSSGRAVLQAQGANQPKRLVSLQLYSAKSLAVELHRGSDGSYGYKLAPGATENDDERVSSLPSAGSAAGPGARTVVAGSASFVKTTSSTLAATLAPSGLNGAALKELTQAFAGFAPSARIEVLKARTADGNSRILYARLADGGGGQRSFWWFAPPSQPEGWFDEQGNRLGGGGFGEPSPDSRISSPFGTRRYYGRRTGGGFHNGIDYEAKTGQPIYAAADGVINHQGWYFNYGRTVKISHADNFETLYAHMSRFADGMGPGSRVRKGDLIGYVGSSGRSTGPHLHFSVIVDGQFVDPMQYLTDTTFNRGLVGESLVAYRQWQQEVRKAAGGRSDGDSRFRGLQGAEPWSRNPFSAGTVDRL